VHHPPLSMDYKLVTIILAAGESRRMGRPKLFLPVKDTTLLRHAVDAAVTVNPEGEVIVVTGAYDTQIREHLSPHETILFTYCRSWREGMSNSLSLGVTAGWMFQPTHYLVTLADQPTVDGAALRMLRTESETYPEQIVATQYPERLGVPAIFPASFVKELRDKSGQWGARKLIARQGDNVRAIAFPTPPIDIDTPEDYDRFLKSAGK
ncbi:MAG: nucleotidyltransferase family protein, partial [Bacteroidota bacterium]